MNKDADELSQLEDVDVLEVSLVGHPANKQKFLVIKNEGGDTMPKEDVEKKDEIPEGDELEKKLGEKLTALIEGLSEGDLKALMNLVADKLGYPKPEKKAKKPEDEEYGYPEPKKTRKSDTPKDEEVVKAELDPEVKAQIEALFKTKEELEGKIQKAQADAAHERDLRLGREYLEKARTFKGLPGKPEDLGAILKRLAEADADLYGKIEALLATASVALEKSALMQEFGTAEMPGGGSASERVLAKIKEVVQKNASMNFAQAVKWLEQNDAEFPGLYREYTREARAR